MATLANSASDRASQRRERTGCGKRDAPSGGQARARQTGRNNDLRLRNRTDEWRRLACETPLSVAPQAVSDEQAFGALLERALAPPAPLTFKAATELGGSICQMLADNRVTTAGMLNNDAAHLRQLIAVTQACALGPSVPVAIAAMSVLARCAASTLAVSKACAEHGAMALIGLIMKHPIAQLDHTLLYYAMRLCGALVCAAVEYRYTLVATGLLDLIALVLSQPDLSPPAYVQCCFVLEMVCNQTRRAAVPPGQRELEPVVASAAVQLAALVLKTPDAPDAGAASVLRTLSTVCEAGVDFVQLVLDSEAVAHALGADIFAGSAERITAHMLLCVSLGLGTDTQLAQLYRTGVAHGALMLLNSDTVATAVYAAQTLHNLMCGSVEQAAELLLEVRSTSSADTAADVGALPRLAKAATRQEASLKTRAAAFSALLAGVCTVLEYNTMHPADARGAALTVAVLHALRRHAALISMACLELVGAVPARVLASVADAYTVIMSQTAYHPDPQISALRDELLTVELYDCLTMYLGEEQSAIGPELVDVVAAVLDLYDTYGVAHADDQAITLTHGLATLPPLTASPFAELARTLAPGQSPFAVAPTTPAALASPQSAAAAASTPYTAVSLPMTE